MTVSGSRFRGVNRGADDPVGARVRGNVRSEKLFTVTGTVGGQRIQGPDSPITGRVRSNVRSQKLFTVTGTVGGQRFRANVYKGQAVGGRITGQVIISGSRLRGSHKTVVLPVITGQLTGVVRQGMFPTITGQLSGAVGRGDFPSVTGQLSGVIGRGTFPTITGQLSGTIGKGTFPTITGRLAGVLHQSVALYSIVVPTQEEQGQICYLVEIDQDFCELVYGVGACAAVLGTTGDNKCYNTRATCQDPDNYTRGTLTLRFAKPAEYLVRLQDVGIRAIPSIDSLDSAPSIIRAGDGLGARASITLRFNDHPYHDRQVDKYAAERITGAANASGTPHIPAEQGTFWGKWRARNPYYEGRSLRIRQGTVAQFINGSGTETRGYILDSVTGPDNRGRFKVTAKDVLKLADDDKAQAPAASPGRLLAGIDDVATSATLTPVSIGDQYAASGFVVIDDEIMAFTRSGDVLTLTRGQRGTTADSHSADAKAQEALAYDGQKISAVIYDLLVNYSDIPSGYINLTDWTTEDDAFINRLFSTTIAEPTGLKKLIESALLESGAYIWWDDVAQKIRFQAIHAPDVPPLVLKDSDDMLMGSVTVKEQEQRRVSDVWVYFGALSFTDDLSEAKNFSGLQVASDLAAKSLDQYRVQKIEKIYCRWISGANLSAAQDLALRRLSRYRDPPRKLSFDMPWNQQVVNAGEVIDVQTRYIQNFDGTDKLTRALVTSYEREPDMIRVDAEEFLYTDDEDTTEKTVSVTSSQYNIDFRAAYDSIFTSVESGDTVTLIIFAGVIVGSASTASYALTVGTWPAGVTLNIINYGRIQGAGGEGGEGGDDGGGWVPTVGFDGGPALFTDENVTFDNQGEIWGGGGGGGGGGAATIFGGAGDGGGGNGGAGFVPGDGGLGGDRGAKIEEGTGDPGTTEAGGTKDTGEHNGGSGGNGGGPGLAGDAGENSLTQSGAAGGSAGSAVVGAGYITWTTEGDRRGPES